MKPGTGFIDLQPDRALCSPADDQCVVTGCDHEFGNRASRVRFRKETGEGRFCEDPVPAGTENRAAVERAGRKNDVIVRSERIHLCRIIFQQQVQSEAFAA